MANGNVEMRLRDLGIDLPAAPEAVVSAYTSVVRTGNLVVTSGQLPWKDGALSHEGRLGVEVSDEEGYEAARYAALNGIAQLKKAAGDLDKVRRIVRVEGYVHCGSGYRDQPQVLNGASDLLNEVFGDAGVHARSAVGIHEMPLNSPVQIVIWAEVAD